jgi:hypothetical protein
MNFAIIILLLAKVVLAIHDEDSLSNQASSILVSFQIIFYCPYYFEL